MTGSLFRLWTAILACLLLQLGGTGNLHGVRLSPEMLSSTLKMESAAYMGCDQAAPPCSEHQDGCCHARAAGTDIPVPVGMQQVMPAPVVSAALFSPPGEQDLPEANWLPARRPPKIPL